MNVLRHEQKHAKKEREREREKKKRETERAREREGERERKKERDGVSLTFRSCHSLGFKRLQADKR